MQQDVNVNFRASKRNFTKYLVKLEELLGHLNQHPWSKDPWEEKDQVKRKRISEWMEIH